MNIIAIDPGTIESAYVELDNGNLLSFGKVPNEKIIEEVLDESQLSDFVAIEMIASYGMAVGKEVFETCVWIGRFSLAAEWSMNRKPNLVYRREVKIHFCNSMKAKDGNIRQAIIDRYGGKDKAIGKKNTPGPLYGIKDDIWQALAIALLVQDQLEATK